MLLLLISLGTAWGHVYGAGKFIDWFFGEGKMHFDHDLKSWVGLFDPIARGEKTHELRVMDREYKVGQVCRLREWEPLKREYTGRECYVKITYITSSQHRECAFSPVALHPATGILSITLLPKE